MKKLRLLALLLVATVPFAACDGEGDPVDNPIGSIQGTVVVEGSPASGVTVSISGPESATATTGADGSFSFADVQTGSYTVSISNTPSDATFASTSQSVSVAANSTATVDFSGDYIRTASINGAVVADTQDGEANVSGITVTLAGVESRTTTTDGNGEFSFAGLRAGSYTVSIDATGLDINFGSTQQSVQVSAGGSANVTFTGLVPAAAQVYIQRITNQFGTHVDPDDVEGRVYVEVAIEPGTETVTRAGITLNGTEVASQDVNVTSSASSEAGASSAVNVTFAVNSAAFNAQTLQVAHPNGQYEIGAFLETAEGTTAEANTSQTLVFDNEDVLAVEWTEGSGNIAVGDGVRYHGGASLQIEALALLYSAQVEIDEVTVACAAGAATANGGAALDIGSGAGAAHTVSGPPFQFSASLADNAGAVEDAGPTAGGAGHVCSVTSVRDPSGLELITEFDPANVFDLDEFFVDFVPPAVAAPGADADVTIDGTAPTGAGQFFSAGDFELASLSELGVGGTNVRWAVDSDGDSEADIEPVTSVGNLAELSPNDYTLLVVGIEDALGNAHDLDPVTGAPVAGGDNESLGFGVDKGAPEVTDIFPAAGATLVLNPDDDNGDGTANNDILFSAADPDLADGTVGAGIGVPSAELSDATAVTVTALGGGDFSIDAGQAAYATDKTYSTTATVPDVAIAPNETEVVWSVVIDSTDPTTNMINAPASSTTSSNATLTFTIEGSASDTNGLGEVLVTVRDADGASGATAGVCELADDLIAEGTDPGEVLDNEIDVTADASGFSTNVTIHNTGDGSDQNVCFYIEAADNALNNEGDPEPNTSNQSATTAIDWL